VSEQLRKGGDFGGEPSGSWIFPGISLCPDGIYAAAQIASIASRQKLSLLIDRIPSYPLLRGGVSSEGIVVSRLEQQLMAMKPLAISNIDGIKLSFEDGWLLIRASGTEPKIRVTAEARSKAKVRKLYNNGIEAIHKCIETGKA
jgi:phosphoglucosamine mutase